MRQRLTFLAAVAFATSLAAGSAEAQGRFSPWDRDKDGIVERNEFGDGATTRDAYNGIGGPDGRMDQNEFNNFHETFGDDFDTWDQNAFRTWDTDRDGYLDQREFGDGVYGAYDRDGDRRLDEQELNRMKQDGIFG